MALVAIAGAKELQGFSGIASNPVRRALNARLFQDVLGIEPAAVGELTRKMALEPTMHARQ